MNRNNIYINFTKIWQKIYQNNNNNKTSNKEKKNTQKSSNISELVYS